jgi:superfamily II DNA/RNA helicase
VHLTCCYLAFTSPFDAENRQSMLFSATQTTKVTDLARISLRPGPVHIDVDKEQSTSTVSTLSQGYVVCPSDRRFLLLFTFLKKNLKKKVIVFFSSCNSVKYHGELLNYIDVPVLDLHVCSNLSCRLDVPRLIVAYVGETKATKANQHVFRIH